MSNPAYEQVTKALLESIDRGTLPWRQPWKKGLGGGAMPWNTASKRTYQGVNTLVLWCAQINKGFPTTRWGTYAQWAEKGGQVRKGEKGSAILFFKPYEKKDGTKSIIARTSFVFNEAQVDIAEETAEETTVEPTKNPFAAYLSTGPSLTHGGDRACYVPSRDMVCMPVERAFETREAYLATLAHELVHSTGHASRLNRPFGASFGDHNYSEEELVAEIGAAFLCAEFGIQNTLDQSAAYLATWARKLKANPDWIAKAASQAAKAAKLIASAEMATEQLAAE